MEGDGVETFLSLPLPTPSSTCSNTAEAGHNVDGSRRFDGASDSPKGRERRKDKDQGARELEQTMVQSMCKAFPREVWEACEIQHPDEERDLQARKAQQLVSGAFSGNTRSRFFRSSQVTLEQEEQEEERKRQREEEVCVHLARNTGWHVLDVMDVRDTFMDFANPGGLIPCDGEQFKRMCMELSPDAGLDAAKAVAVHLTNRRRRATKRRGDAPQKAGGYHISFGEFFHAWLHWLHAVPEAAEPGRSRSYTRFGSQSAPRKTDRGSATAAVVVSLTLAKPTEPDVRSNTLDSQVGDCFEGNDDGESPESGSMAEDSSESEDASEDAAEEAVPCQSADPVRRPAVVSTDGQ